MSRPAHCRAERWWEMIRARPQPCGDSFSASCWRSACLRQRRQAFAFPRSTTRGTAPSRTTGPTGTGRSTGTIRRTTSPRRTTRRAGLYSSSDQLVIGAADGRDPRRQGSTRSSSRGGERARPRIRRLPAVIVGGARRRDHRRRSSRAVRRPNRCEHGGRHRLSAQLRRHVVLCLPPVRSASRRLGGGEDRAARRRRRSSSRRPALVGDAAQRRLRRRLHLRHRHLRRQHVPSPLCPGACAASSSARRRSGPATTRGAEATTRA